jgi:hypothetical protein
MSIIGLLVVLLVFCAVYWVAMRILKAFGVGDPIATIVQVIIVICALLWLLSAFGYGPGLRLR